MLRLRRPVTVLLTVLVTALVTVLLVLIVARPAGASGEPWTWPLDHHDVGERFDPPADHYGAGHRGVDLRGSVGEAVHAVAAGQVVFAGQVGGVPVVTIDHGGERSTYQPVDAVVQLGDAVTAGQVIGTLRGEHSHCDGACLHLGRLAGDTYLDPMERLGPGRFVLVSPDGAPPTPPAAAGGSLLRPVGGPVTSPFGMRVHPITGVRKLHDGTDFGVPCGTPVHAAASGTVVASGADGAYGLRLTIRQGPGFETSYAHLSSLGRPVGGSVGAGDVIGRSGTTGLSTGCHLHFMVLVDGTPTDPIPLL